MHSINSRKKNNKSRSVASFFISRIDTAADTKINNESIIFHKVAIANAYNAYDYFNKNRFRMDNNFQKLLWASTSVKSKDLKEDYYSVNLPHENTINTLPPETLNFLLNLNNLKIIKLIISKIITQKLLQNLKNFFNLEDITDGLLINGIDLFMNSYNSLLEKLEKKLKSLLRLKWTYQK